MACRYSGYTPGFRTIPPTQNLGSENVHNKYGSSGFSVVYEKAKILDNMRSNRRAVSYDHRLQIIVEKQYPTQHKNSVKEYPFLHIPC